jgi:hypothetical protein
MDLLFHLCDPSHRHWYYLDYDENGYVATLIQGIDRVPCLQLMCQF